MYEYEFNNLTPKLLYKKTIYCRGFIELKVYCREDIFKATKFDEILVKI